MINRKVFTETKVFLFFPDVLATVRTGTCEASRSFVSSKEMDKTFDVPDSEVSVSIPKGPEKAYFAQVSTDFSKYLAAIPPHENPVAPLVEIQELQPSSGPNKLCTVNIPHSVKNPNNWKYIRVRKYKTQQQPTDFESLRAKEKEDTESEGFWVEKDFIRVQIRSFSIFSFTAEKKHCTGDLKIFLFGNLQRWEQGSTIVHMKFFLCSHLYSLMDFRKV